MTKFESKLVKNLLILLILFILILMGGYIMLKRQKTNKADYIKGEVIVGFQKGVLRSEAEMILSEHNLKFEEPLQLNVSKAFIYETGEKFIVNVPKGKEKYWVRKLEKEQNIKKVILHVDASKAIID